MNFRAFSWASSDPAAIVASGLADTSQQIGPCCSSPLIATRCLVLLVAIAAAASSCGGGSNSRPQRSIFARKAASSAVRVTRNPAKTRLTSHSVGLAKTATIACATFIGLRRAGRDKVSQFMVKNPYPIARGSKVYGCSVFRFPQAKLNQSSVALHPLLRIVNALMKCCMGLPGAACLMSVQSEPVCTLADSASGKDSLRRIHREAWRVWQHTTREVPRPASGRRLPQIRAGKTPFASRGFASNVIQRPI